MTVTTLSSREFIQDTCGARQAASQGPVFITEEGRPAQVLLTFEEYRRLSAGSTSIIDLLAMPGIDEVEFEPPRATGLLRPVSAD